MRNSENNYFVNPDGSKIPSVVFDPINPNSKYQILDFLGIGSFGKCYKVRDLSDPESSEWACKVLEKSNITTIKIKERLQFEVQIVQCLPKHNRIVYGHKVFQDQYRIYIIMELCSKKTMETLIRARKRLNEFEARYFFLQVVEGILELHRRRIIHRDIKLANIFLTEANQVKIGDFGLSAFLERIEDRKTSFLGTLNYLSPEVVLRGKHGHSFGVDVWALGVFLYVMLVGKTPFTPKQKPPKPENYYYEICKGTVEFPSDTFISDEAKDLILSLCQKSEEKRIKSAQIKFHPWIMNHRRLIPENMPDFIFEHPIHPQKWNREIEIKLRNRNYHSQANQDPVYKTQTNKQIIENSSSNGSSHQNSSNNVPAFESTNELNPSAEKSSPILEARHNHNYARNISRNPNNKTLAFPDPRNHKNFVNRQVQGHNSNENENSQGYSSKESNENFHVHDTPRLLNLNTTRKSSLNVNTGEKELITVDSSSPSASRSSDVHKFGQNHSGILTRLQNQKNHPTSKKYIPHESISSDNKEDSYSIKEEAKEIVELPARVKEALLEANVQISRKSANEVNTNNLKKDEGKEGTQVETQSETASQAKSNSLLVIWQSKLEVLSVRFNYFLKDLEKQSSADSKQSIGQAEPGSRIEQPTHLVRFVRVPKYGLGYELSNGTVGVSFRDKSSLLLVKDNPAPIIVIVNNGRVEIKQLPPFDQIKVLDQKIALFSQFQCAIKEQQFTKHSQKNKETNESKNISYIFVTKYLSARNVSMYRLSNGAIQVCFKDGSQLLFFEDNKITFTDKLTNTMTFDISDPINKIFSSKSFNHKELVNRINYTAKILEAAI
ncbi:hypothetical protein BB560_000716 [Smittium megazygosporum]|uniref:Serine/threonine-protein kinase n=1 Tax=Smittium megazygosporum TaxID=133381 RepID=A0A2T9ZJP4_9FUNG|nr:hypothetical protein BB560_000716 [Smittium megazygosporum]